MKKYIPNDTDLVRHDKTSEEVTNINTQNEINKYLQYFGEIYLNISDIFIKGKTKPIFALLFLKTVFKIIVYFVKNIEPDVEDIIEMDDELREEFYNLFVDLMELVYSKDLSLDDFFVIISCIIEALTVSLSKYNEPEKLEFSKDFYLNYYKGDDSNEY